jgi:hypothetical protein
MKIATLGSMVGLLAALWAAPPAALAIAVRDGAAPGLAKEAPSRPRTDRRSRAEAPTLDLVTGQLTAVDRERKTVTITGKVIALHPSRLRVFRVGEGKRGIEALQAGARVRFALEPGAAEPRRIVLIYIERTP